MGAPGPFRKSCFTNTNAIAPNPSPSNFLILDHIQFDNAYVLKVKYIGCTNFEGIKVMVFTGKYSSEPLYLDPHFANDNKSPIARFKPDPEGWNNALKFAKEY